MFCPQSAIRSSPFSTRTVLGLNLNLQPGRHPISLPVIPCSYKLSHRVPFSCSSSLSKNTQKYSLELPWRGTRTSLPIKMKTKTEMVNINARVKRFNLFAFCIRTFHLSTYLPTFLPAYPKNPVVDVVAESSSFRSDDLAGRHTIIRAHSPRDVVNYKHRHKR